MKPTPPGWPRISAAVFYEDPAAAIDFLVRAFGFEVQMKVEGDEGRIVHSELVFGGGLVMVGGVGPKYEDPERPWRARTASPKSTGGKVTQNLCVYVDDADAHAAHARSAGAEIVYEPKTTDYGDDHWADRSYAAIDPEGHLWWFLERVRGPGADAK